MRVERSAIVLALLTGNGSLYAAPTIAGLKMETGSPLASLTRTCSARALV